MSLRQSISRLNQALHAHDEAQCKAHIAQIDWAQWNAQMRQTKGVRGLSFWQGLAPSAQEHEASLVFKRAMIAELAQAGCNVLLTGGSVLMDSNPELCESFTQAHKTYGYVDGQGATPLHWAAREVVWGGNCVEVCLQQGLDANALDTSGENPLHGFWYGVGEAARCGDLTRDRFENLVVNLQSLLMAGANPRQARNDGKTPEDLMQDAIASNSFLKLASEPLIKMIEATLTHVQGQQLDQGTPTVAQTKSKPRL